MIRAAALVLAGLVIASCSQHGRDPAAQASADAVSGPNIVDTATLFGLLAEDVNALFGEPRLTRRDGPAQVWQYANAVCVLDLFLYADADPAAPHVTYFEVREGGAAARDALPCVQSLLRRAQQDA